MPEAAGHAYSLCECPAHVDLWDAKDTVTMMHLSD